MVEDLVTSVPAGALIAQGSDTMPVMIRSNER